MSCYFTQDSEYETFVESNPYEFGEVNTIEDIWMKWKQNDATVIAKMDNKVSEKKDADRSIIFSLLLIRIIYRLNWFHYISTCSE